jgi:hypothetical protein
MSRNEAFDRITILLIDDEPQGLSRERALADGQGKASYPTLQAAKAAPDSGSEIPFSDYFRLLWLATPAEAHDYFDYVMNLARARPELLAEIGCVPDLLLFDYALTGDVRKVHERELPAELVAELSPLTGLAAAHRSLFGAALDKVGRGITACPSKPPEIDAGVRGDNFGCFSGGLIFMAFNDHPCGPVALTRKGQDKTIGTEAAFFEWMLHRQSDGTFKAAGMVDVNWPTLLRLGVKALRTRLSELARGHRVTIDLVALLDLADGKARPDLPVLTAYGLKRYPTDALFLDRPTASRQGAATEWAVSLIADLVESGRDYQTSTLHDLRAAEQGSGRLWAAYQRDDFGEREDLSNLLQQGQDTLSDTDRAELARLETHFRVNYNRRGNRGQRGYPTGACRENWFDLTLVEGTQTARRWAALMVIVRHIFNSADELDLSSLFRWLFPVPGSPLVLPDDPSGCWSKKLDDLTKTETSPGLDLNLLLKKAKTDGGGIRNETAAGEDVIGQTERRILRSYALAVLKDLKLPEIRLRRLCEDCSLLKLLIGSPR